MKIVQLTTDAREAFKHYEYPKPYFGTAPQGLLDGFEDLPDTEIHVISCSHRAMESPKKIAANIYFHQPIVPKFGWGRTAFLGCAIAVRNILKHLKPDVIHAQGTERDCAVSMMLAPTIPCLLTIHGHMARIAEITAARFPSYYWLASQLESLAIRRADGVIAITNYTQDRVMEQCRKSWVVPNAVDASFFDVNSPTTGRIVLCVGAITPWKRQLELILALDQLPEDSRPRVVFLGTLGGNAYAKQVQAAIDQREWCEYQGFTDRETLKQWLAKAALLILPSIEDNCPMVILEAMAAGVPVAAARIGGIPDLIDDGRTGYLFDPQDQNSIRQAVLNWTQNREKAATLARTAKQEALIRFHPRVIAERHMEIYREVLGR